MDIEDSRNLEMMRNAIFACNLKRRILKIVFTKGDERNTEGLTANVVLKTNP